MKSIEDKFYEIAIMEIARRSPDPAIMARAISDCDGDERKTIAKYIKLRVSRLKQEYIESEKKAREEVVERERKRKEQEKAARFQNEPKIACCKCGTFTLESLTVPFLNKLWCEHCFRREIGLK